ncbi:MAG: DUF3343 domain-containing protein [Chloroflexi bacterium]|nr:DUF3343 domain-containing protein [Chloroflexota bacterium]
MSEGYAVILVPSTSYAIQIERLLQESGILCKLIPVPRHLSSDCGVCVRIERVNAGRVLAAIREAGVNIEALYEI